MRKLAPLLILIAGILVLLVVTVFPFHRGRLDQKSLKNYSFGRPEYTIGIPTTTTVTEATPGGQDILFNAILLDRSLGFRGYLQIWTIPDLQKFLETSKAQSLFNFTLYRQTRLPNNQGFLVEWSAKLSSGKPVAAREYFLQTRGHEVVRLSLFTDTPQFPQKLAAASEQMLNSLKLMK